MNRFLICYSFTDFYQIMNFQLRWSSLENTPFYTCKTRLLILISEVIPRRIRGIYKIFTAFTSKNGKNWFVQRGYYWSYVYIPISKVSDRYYFILGWFL